MRADLGGWPQVRAQRPNFAYLPPDSKSSSTAGHPTCFSQKHAKQALGIAGRIRRQNIEVGRLISRDFATGHIRHIKRLPFALHDLGPFPGRLIKRQAPGPIGTSTHNCAGPDQTDRAQQAEGENPKFDRFAGPGTLHASATMPSRDNFHVNCMSTI